MSDRTPDEVEAETRRHCLEAWPDAFVFGYDPRCCRFPKSCSIPADPQPRTPDAGAVVDEVGCCGMCDDECDCESIETCLYDWRSRAEAAEHNLSLADADLAAARSALARVEAVIDSTEWYCADDHEWGGRARLITRLRAALAPAPAEPGSSSGGFAKRTLKR